MMKLKCKEPCKKCPFKRDSLKGWLGDSTPEEFILTTAENDMPCHLTIDYEKKDWNTKGLKEASLCSGALIFLKNSLTTPKYKPRAELLNKVEKNVESIFTWKAEFLTHHII